MQVIDVGIAVGSARGLVVPILRDADQMSFAEIEQQIRYFAKSAEDGTLSLADLKGGTFTITNLGAYGVEGFTPIVNPPQSCILGVGSTEQVPVIRNGQVVPGSMMSLTLAADHRAIDGATGAELLAAIRGFVERPMSLMLGI